MRLRAGHRLQESDEKSPSIGYYATLRYSVYSYQQIRVGGYFMREEIQDSMLKHEIGQGQDENWRILIVEDDERLATLTKDYLESNGLTVSIEGDGGRAIERIKTEQPDLVVLDLMLPGEDGLAVCRIVRPYYKGPILMLTARTEGSGSGTGAGNGGR